MHFVYGSTTDGPQTFNAVNVRNSRGQFEYGRVINVLENGLVVDFDCPGRRSELVEHGNVYRTQNWFFQAPVVELYNSLFKEYATAQIEVLMRESLDRPLAWYSAKFLVQRAYWNSVVLTEVQLEHGTLPVLVPAGHIRMVSSPEEQDEERIINDYFVIRTRQLPETYQELIGTDLPMWHMWDGFKDALIWRGRVYPVCVLDGTLVYVEARERIIYFAENMMEHIKDAVNDVTNKINEPLYCRKTTSPAFGPTSFETDESVQNQFTRLSELPPCILSEIFQYVPPDERAQYRRVCALWDLLLNRDVAFQHISVSCSWQRSSYSRRGYHSEDYTAGLCLLKCVTRATSSIVITDAQDYKYRDWLGDILRPQFQSVLYGVKALASACNRVSPVCDGIMWRECALSVRCKYIDTASVPYGVINPGSANIKADLYDLFEKGLPGVDLARLSHWITSVVRPSRNSHFLKDIEWLLLDCQHHDQETKWTKAKLKRLDVAQLSSFSIYALDEKMRKERPK
ncbi:uncharacterized protein LOC129596386 isoform X2 [Paramacrobiotus metropolitanus]|uniref:uncharacterized protein LOC129596386 isoform X2 n=1 Tax=Paramacrobiotus metropolitanus TaxID=2943436 RepID=UPI002445B724|nr:uncharacterized protein LOC129596386 isoform X2 [Paramacrobiotus metropolitanus]